MKKNTFKGICRMYANAEEVAKVAAKIAQVVKDGGFDAEQEKNLTDLCKSLAGISAHQKEALHEKFNACFALSDEELRGLKENYPFRAPQQECAQGIGLRDFSVWLDANPEMLSLARGEFFTLDYALFGELYAGLFQLKQERRRLLSFVGNGMFPFIDEDYRLCCVVFEEQQYLDSQFAANFPETLELARGQKNFSLERFYRLLIDNPRLITNSKKAFRAFARSMEMRNFSVPQKLWEIYNA